METMQEMGPLKKGEVKLFSYFRSSSSFRVRIALNFKKIPYQTIGVHLLEAQQSSAEYKKLNPSGLVPALWIDDACLSESLPILEYLEETRPECPLLPKSPLDRVQVIFCHQQKRSELSANISMGICSHCRTSD